MHRLVYGYLHAHASELVRTARTARCEACRDEVLGWLYRVRAAHVCRAQLRVCYIPRGDLGWLSGINFNTTLVEFVVSLLIDGNYVVSVISLNWYIRWYETLALSVMSGNPSCDASTNDFDDFSLSDALEQMDLSTRATEERFARLHESLRELEAYYKGLREANARLNKDRQDLAFNKEKDLYRVSCEMARALRSFNVTYRGMLCENARAKLTASYGEQVRAFDLRKQYISERYESLERQLYAAHNARVKAMKVGMNTERDESEHDIEKPFWDF